MNNFLNLQIMETNVQFYFEPYERQGVYKEKHILLTEWWCRSRKEIVMYVMAMLIGAHLKYKRFRVAAYNAETGELIHSTVNYN